MEKVMILTIVTSIGMVMFSCKKDTTEQSIDTTRIQETTLESNIIYQFEDENITFDTDNTFLVWFRKKESRSVFAKKYCYVFEQQQFSKENGFIANDESTEKLITAQNNSNDRSSSMILNKYTNLNHTSSFAPVHTPYCSSFNNRIESVLFTPLTGVFYAQKHGTFHTIPIYRHSDWVIM